MESGSSCLHIIISIILPTLYLSTHKRKKISWTDRTLGTPSASYRDIESLIGINVHVLGLWRNPVIDRP